MRGLCFSRRSVETKYFNMCANKAGSLCMSSDSVAAKIVPTVVSYCIFMDSLFKVLYPA